MLKLREDEIESYARELLSDRYMDNLNKIEIEFFDNKQKILSELTDAFDQLFKKGIELQRKNEKEKIGFISIFYLKSSIVTGSYEIMINLYDKSYYFDRKEVSACWKPMFIIRYFIDDIEYLQKAIKTKIIRPQRYEIDKIKMQYCNDYFKVIECFLEKYIDEITSLDSFNKLQKEEDIKITLGEYLDKSITLYPDPYQLLYSLLLSKGEGDKQ